MPKEWESGSMSHAWGCFDSSLLFAVENEKRIVSHVATPVLSPRVGDTLHTRQTGRLTQTHTEFGRPLTSTTDDTSQP